MISALIRAANEVNNICAVQVTILLERAVSEINELRHQVGRVADATRFQLRSTHQVFAVMYPEKPELLAGLSELLDRLELGLPANALPLTEITGLSRGQYLALLQRGCRTPSDVDAIPYATLVDIVGEVGAVLIRGKDEEDEEAAQVS